MQWEKAPEVKKKIIDILKTISLPHVTSKRIYTYRSFGSQSRSYARIWSFPKIFQDALHIEPAYVIEVLAKYYDKLPPDEQAKVLIHELLHIPKNFSGALLPHRSSGRQLEKTAEVLYKEYKKTNI